MKKFLLIIFALIAVMTLTACNKKDSDIPDGMQYFEKNGEDNEGEIGENEAIDYRVYFPEGWICDRNDLVVSAHVSDEDRSNVSVMAYTPSGDDYQYIQENSFEKWINESFKKSLENSFLDYSLVEGLKEAKLGEKDARSLVYTVSVDSQTYKIKQLITNYKGNIYVLTYTSPEESYGANLEALDMIIKHFEFK